MRIMVILIAEMNDQQTDDVSQSQTAGIAHKKFMPPLGIAKHIIEPERHNHAESGKSQQGKKVIAPHDAHHSQHGQRNATQAGGQSVNAINQINGIGDVHDDKQRQRRPNSHRQLTNAT